MIIDINELRRLAQEATPGPWKMLPVGNGRQKFAVADSEFLSILTVTDEGGATFGTVCDDADAKFIAAASPAAISELLNRLESAEKELVELRSSMKFRTSLIGRTEAERDALRDRLALESQESGAFHEAVERACEERDALRAEIEELHVLIAAVKKQADAEFCLRVKKEEACARLQAKVEAMERQSPICRIKDIRRAHYMTKVVGLDPEAWLYALPGAQGDKK